MRRKGSAVLERVRPEVKMQTARSGGPGGQNVNKVETKVILRFDVSASQALSQREKELVQLRLATSLTRGGELIVSADGSRSQLQNKERAFKKLEWFLARAFAQKKARKKTKPSKTAIEKRLKAKKQNAEKKAMRRKP